MKKILVTVLVCMMLYSLTACGRSGDSNESNPPSPSENTANSGKAAPKSPAAGSVQDVKIKLTFGNEEVIATMYDNPTSRDLLAQLPLTITFKDYAGLEKIGYPPNTLTKEGAPSGADPKVGDLALYAPWGNLVIYYGDNNYASGIVILGHIESGVEKFAKMDQDFKVTIEKVD